jgi:chaperonin GroES
MQGFLADGAELAARRTGTGTLPLALGGRECQQRHKVGLRRRNCMNLQPLGDRLIVEVLEEEETTVSGIVLPDTAKEKPQRGRVLAVGPGPRDEDGEYIKMDVEEGDEVIFSKYGGTEIRLGADEVLILRESDVLAKVVGDRAAV